MDITDIGAFEAQFDALCGDALVIGLERYVHARSNTGNGAAAHLLRGCDRLSLFVAK